MTRKTLAWAIGIFLLAAAFTAVGYHEATKSREADDDRLLVIVSVAPRMLERQQEINALVVDIGVGCTGEVDHRVTTGLADGFGAGFGIRLLHRPRFDRRNDLARIYQIRKNRFVIWHR